MNSDLLFSSENAEDVEASNLNQNNPVIGNAATEKTLLLDVEVFEVVANFTLSKSVVPFLAGRGLTKRSLLLLRSEHISKIFPDSELGLQLEFEDELLKWKKIEYTQCSTVCSEITTAEWVEDNCLTPSSASSSQESNLNLTPVKDILLLSLAGRDVLDKHSSNRLLNQRQQKQVVQLIVEYYKLKSRKLRTHELDRIAKDIASTFHRENKSTYFVPPCGKYSHPTGMLYNAYHNYNRGRTKYTAKFKSQLIDQHNTAPLPIPLIDKEKYDEIKQFLKFNSRPWTAIEEKWKETTTNRLNEIKENSNKNSLQILNEWPLYKHADSFTLVNIDFESMHPLSTNNLFSKHSEVNALLIKYYQAEDGLKNKEYKKLLDDICLLDESCQTFPLFYFLSAVLTPTQIIKCPGKTAWRVSIFQNNRYYY